MISNALVWLSSRLCNFIAAGEGFAPVPAGDRSESQEEELGEYGKSQKALLEKWKSLAREIEVWFERLPATFQPTTRIKSSRNMTFDLRELDQASSCSFDQIWYTNGMVCYFGISSRIPDFNSGRKTCLFCSSDRSCNLTQKVTQQGLLPAVLLRRCVTGIELMP